MHLTWRKRARGILLLIFGVNTQWLPIPTLLLWPAIVILFNQLAKEEAKDMEDRLGEEYLKYK